MAKVKPRTPPVEEYDPIERAMCADLPPEPLMTDAEGLRLMQNPEYYADHPLPAGLWQWCHAQPGGAEIWRDWIAKTWRATDEKLAAKREEKVNA
jgi:hypothetical protein